VYNEESSTRHITRDNLSAYFINKIYDIPNITTVGIDEEVDFESFLSEFVESSFASKEQCDKFNLGTNRLRLLVGKVGEGKSAFIQKVISEINNRNDELDNKYKLLTIYFNILEKYHYGYEPIPLKGNFLIYLYNKIYEEIDNRIDSDVDMVEMSGINPSANPVLSLKLLISHLKQQKVRILLFIDNLDFYHYYYARYSFFAKYNKQQEKAINDNIMWLLSIFNSKENLGQMGLNVMIAVRQYVYEDIVSKEGGVKTDIDTTEAIRISVPSEETIFRTRFKLLSKAIDVVTKKKPGAGRELNNMFRALQTKLLAAKFETTETTVIKTINKLGQHGNRSLVSFFSSLNLTYLDYELIDRFFVRQVSTLYILYFNNMYKKYTQKQDHFPNLFLVDCTVMDEKNFQDAHKPHMHTYWLKYFLLKLIVKKNGIKFNEIMDMFFKVGGYDDHLVRHVTGSLCTANEFRCAEIDYNEAGKNFESYKIKATERGRFLFDESRGIEFCFDFKYLGVIIDDQWLSFPNEFSESIFMPKMEYSYLYDTELHYIKASIDSVIKKARCLLHFVKVLEASFVIEIEQNKPKLHSIFQEYKLVPNFDLINDHIINSAESIVKTFKKDSELSRIEKLRELRMHLTKDKSHIKFFEKYYQTDIEVSP
jgi:hypothetical protein